MESDRRVALLIQAAAAGRLDPSQARPHDRWWYHRLGWVLASLEAEHLESALERRHRVLCAALAGRAGWDDVSKLIVQLDEVSQEILTLRMPWLGDGQKKQREQAARNMSLGWARQFGDPNDPKVREAIQATARALLARNKKKSR